MRVNVATSASARTLLSETDARRAEGAGFAAALRQSVASLAQAQRAADAAAESVAAGDLSQLHEAMIAIQRANLALEYAIAVRNHVVEGVQELLRTQT